MTEKTCMTDGSPVDLNHREINKDTGQQKGYVVLCPEERAKGYVRPLRKSYLHVGVKPKFPLRDLTEKEKVDWASDGYVKYEVYPQSERPKCGQFWTQKQLDGGCGVVTTIATSIAETYARKPDFYSGTFCCGCGEHFPLAEFRWTADDTVVGS